MKLTPNDLAALCADLRAHCERGLVQRVWSGRDDEVLLQMRAPGETSIILLAAGTERARIHRVPERTARPEEPAPFVRLLRKQIMGLRLTAIQASADDRVVHLTLSGRGESWTLVGELTGRHGNAFLLDGAGIIRGSLRHNVSHRRRLVPGEPWEPPTRTDAAAAAYARDDALPADVADPSTWLHEHTEADIALDDATRRRVEARRRVRKALSRVERLLKKVSADHGRAAQADEKRRWGQLLQSAYGQVARGASRVRVPDYEDPELAEVEVPLDPTRSLADNIERYFRDAKRLDAARARIEERLAEASVTRDALAAALAAIDADDDDGSGPDAIVADLVAQRLLPPERTQAPRSKRKAEARLPYRQFTSASGKAILVGRGARDNDTLSLRIARGRDLWLHADDAAGAHVIVRLERGEVIDQDTLIDAAVLAAHYSRLREERSVEVRYARPVDLRKPKGAPAGLVSVLRSKTVTVRMEPERIERLFGSSRAFP